MSMEYQNEAEFVQLVRIFQELARELPMRVLELGSLHGATLEYWIKNAIRGSTVISVDMVVPECDGRHRLQRAGHDTIWPAWAEKSEVKLTVLETDSTAPATVAKVKEALGGPLDFLFIDAGHTFAQVQADFRNYGPLVRTGGVIAVHDIAGTDWPEVKVFWERLKRGKRTEEFLAPDRLMGIGVIYVEERMGVGFERRHIYHVITPFCRLGNLMTLIPMLREQGVIWHPVFDQEMPRMTFTDQWIEPCCAPKWVPGWVPCYSKHNFLLDALFKADPLHRLDDHRFVLMNDDDFLEPGFIDKLDEHEGEALICSLKRGDTAVVGHGINTLVAAHENIRCGSVAGEQVILSGRAHRTRRYGREYTADFDFIAEVVKTLPVTYVPEAFVWFNYLQPGRWSMAPKIH